MALTMSRVDRIPRTYDLASLLGGVSSVPAGATTVTVALLRVGTKPTVATVWTSVTYASGSFSALWVGPDADATGATLVVPTSADAWMKVADAPLVEAVKIERITVMGGGAPLEIPTGIPVVSVNGKTGAAVVVTAADVGAPTTTDLSTGLATKVNSSTYTAGLAGKLDRPTPVELVPLNVYGDSFNIVPGVQTTSGAEPHNRVSKRLGMGTTTTYAVGGYGLAMTAHRLLTGNALDSDNFAITRAGLWAAGTTGVVIVDGGKNDNLYIGGSGAAFQAVIEHSLRSILAMIATGTRVENTDASIVYGGVGTAWGTNADANADSGGNNHRTATGAVGATVTITLPSAGTYYLFSAALDPAAYSVTAASYAVTVDGVAQSDWVIPATKRGRSQNSGIVPVTRKFVVTGAGTHTVVLTGKAGTFASFDFYAPAVAAPPLVVVRKQVKFRSFNGGGAWAWGGQGGGGGTDATLDTVNTIITSVTAEFSNVVLSDPTAAWDKVTMIGADGVHPNDKGAACLADADEAAIRTAVAAGFFAGLNR